MSFAWLFPLIAVAGVLQAGGASMNGALRQALSNPWLAASISFGLSVLPLLTLAAMFLRPLPTASGLSAMPWWAPLGGIAGSLAVVLGLMFVDRIGAGAFNGVLITANVLASLVIDHFGLLNMPTHALGAGRIAGGALMVAGIALIASF